MSARPHLYRHIFIDSKLLAFYFRLSENKENIMMSKKIIFLTIFSLVLGTLASNREKRFLDWEDMITQANMKLQNKSLVGRHLIIKNFLNNFASPGQYYDI